MDVREWLGVTTWKKKVGRHPSAADTPYTKGWDGIGLGEQNITQCGWNKLDSKLKKYFAMNLMNFQSRLCRYYIFQVWKERILYNLWCKNLLGTHLRRKPQRVRLEFMHLMVKAKEIRTYCLISNMFICGGWTVLFPFFSFMFLNSHVPLQAKWNKSGLPGAVSDLRKSLDHIKKGKGYLWNTVTLK